MTPTGNVGVGIVAGTSVTVLPMAVARTSEVLGERR